MVKLHTIGFLTITILMMVVTIGYGHKKKSLKEQEQHYRKLLDDKVEQLISQLESLFMDTSRWPQATLDALNKLDISSLMDKVVKSHQPSPLSTNDRNQRKFDPELDGSATDDYLKNLNLNNLNLADFLTKITNDDGATGDDLTGQSTARESRQSQQQTPGGSTDNIRQILDSSVPMNIVKGKTFSRQVRVGDSDHFQHLFNRSFSWDIG